MYFIYSYKNVNMEVFNRLTYYIKESLLVNMENIYKEEDKM